MRVEGERQAAAAASLLEPVRLGTHTARNRLLFGPHVTNLGRGRALSERHVAYYRRRAAGGCGTLVTETASVHASDWPYERAPLAADCGPGWRSVSDACHAEGALVLASLGHAGLQGSSAYHQAPLWAPSRFPDPASREVPQEMEPEEIALVVDGFAAAARRAVTAGCDGVEVECGQHSLLRQFLSGLTNTRTDAYGEDRARLLHEVLRAVRAALGDAPVLGLRLSCDESAPWAGITPDAAVEIARALPAVLDVVVAVRAGPFDAGGTRPDGHTPQGFAVPLAAALRQVLPDRVVVVAQGSLVDPDVAGRVLADGTADLVEMTRAQIADPDFARTVAGGGAPRPCVLCNQTCQVRDARNPLVTCVVEPSAGYETVDAAADGSDPISLRLLVIGAGAAGLEAARVAAGRGHQVTVVDRRRLPGGALAATAAQPGHERFALAATWLVGECRRLGVTVELGTEASRERIDDHRAAGGRVVLASGSRPRPLDGAPVADGVPGPAAGGVPVVTARAVLEGAVLPAGLVVVDDPVGGPTGVAVAELLAGRGREIVLVTPDPVAGTQLARTGDLAPANARLARAGVRVVRRSVLRDATTLEDRHTGEQTAVPAAVVVDAGHLLPLDELADGRPAVTVVGDAVAPRTLLEAVREGRRAALTLGARE